MISIYRFCVLFILSLTLFSQTSLACSIEITPLRKRFRRAESVFVGKVISIAEYNPSEKEKLLIPEYTRDWKYFSKVTFEINEKWKGDVSKKQDFIAIAYFPCGCPGDDIDQFKEGEEFLVFTEDNNFVSICGSEETASGYTKKKIKRLDSFWFRKWARIYPF